MSRNGPWTMHLTIHAEVDAAGTFTNMPAADTFLFSSHRHIVMADVSGFSEVRLKVNKQSTAAQAGAKLILRYNPTFSTTVGDYVDIGTSEVSVAIDTTNSYLDSGWVQLNDDVQAVEGDDIFLAVVGSGGNGVLDPAFGNISVSFR